MNNSNLTNVARERLNLETSKIAWRELQRFFASGTAVWVDNTLDLVDVAVQFANDNKAQVEAWLQSQKIALVSDLQAGTWLQNESEVWAVVVKPWILVQAVQDCTDELNVSGLIYGEKSG